MNVTAISGIKTQRKAILFRIIFLTALCAFGTGISAQVLKGKVLTGTGAPLPYATIYIQEIMSGVVADGNGEFRINLQKGKYTCEFRSIGFEPATREITMNQGTNDITVTLNEKIIQLNEVTVRPSGEDPAYGIMRKVISRAPYHRYQVASYTSMNYTKGSAKVEKLPGYMKMMISDKKLLALVGKLLVIESQKEIKYQSPSRYKQRLVALKSSIPKELEPGNGLNSVISSIYDPGFLDRISPVSPSAFRYYKFRLHDTYQSGHYQVDKMEVIPKVNSDKLFEGYIYVIENEWNVFYADLNVKEMGTSIRYKITYHEVQPGVFMPVTCEMNTDIGTMGVKGYAKYLVSVKYSSVTLNPSNKNVQTLQANVPNVPGEPQKLTAKQQKINEKTAALLNKSKLSTREAIRLSKLLGSSVEPEEAKQEKASLDDNHFRHTQITKDSLAEKRDSAFWEEIRNVPLSAGEAHSYAIKDSLKTPGSVTTTENSISISLGSGADKNKFHPVTGGSVALSKNVSLSYDGLIKGLLREYNFADGFWLGQKLSLTTRFPNQQVWTLSPSAYYLTADKSIAWTIKNTFSYLPSRNGFFESAFGSTSSDIQGESGEPRLLNSLSSLLFGRNIISFYRKDYFYIRNDIDIANGFRISGSLAFERRRPTANQTSFHFFGATPKENDSFLPNGEAAFRTHNAMLAQLNMEYTPFSHYINYSTGKHYTGSAYPTFGLDLKAAISSGNSLTEPAYQRLNVYIRQKVSLSAFSHLSYRLSVGGYITKDRVYAPDFYYVPTAPLFVTTRQPDESFMLPHNYTYLNGKWGQLSLKYSSGYLLLKRIPLLQRWKLNESLYLNSMTSTGQGRLYSEAGYIIGFDSQAYVGCFAGFDGINYTSVGLKIGLPLFK